VVVKQLVTHTDERGLFRELIRSTDDFFSEGFGQWSHSAMHTGVIKAWHFHRVQVDWWYVVSGVLKAALHDMRPESSTYREMFEVLMGDNQQAQILRIPPGVAHGCKVLQGLSTSSTLLPPFTIRRTRGASSTTILRSDTTGSKEWR